MGWRRALETPEFVVEERDDTPATTRRFRIWRNRSPRSLSGWILKATATA
jgi:hypothetical protein